MFDIGGMPIALFARIFFWSATDVAQDGLIGSSLITVPIWDSKTISFDPAVKYSLSISVSCPPLFSLRGRLREKVMWFPKVLRSLKTVLIVSEIAFFSKFRLRCKDLLVS